jgi:hypothetical protein
MPFLKQYLESISEMDRQGFRIFGRRHETRYRQGFGKEKNAFPKFLKKSGSKCVNPVFHLKYGHERNKVTNVKQKHQTILKQDDRKN